METSFIESKKKQWPNKLRVLMLTYLFPPTFSGGARQALELAKGLRQFDVESFFIGVNFENAPASEEYEGFPVHRFRTINRERLCYLVYMLRVCWLLIRMHNEFDVLHLHSIKPFSFLVLALAKIMRKPVFLSLTLIGNDDPVHLRKKGVLWHLEGKLYRYLNGIICSSTALRESCLQAGLLPEKIAAIPCAISVGNSSSPFRPAKNNAEVTALRQALHLPRTIPIVTFVGFISSRKGCDLLLEAWDELRRRHVSALLLLIGPYQHVHTGQDPENGFQEQLQNMLRQRVQKNVIFTGEVPHVDIPAYLRASDCFVFPSKNEGFGMVVIEAMACGLPVVATRIPGITEDMITHNEDGIIVDKREPEQLAGALQILLEDDNKRYKLAAKAIQKVNNKFSLEMVARKHYELYMSHLQGKRQQRQSQVKHTLHQRQNADFALIQ